MTWLLQCSDVNNVKDSRSLNWQWRPASKPQVGGNQTSKTSGIGFSGLRPMPFLIVPRRRQSKGTGLKWQVRVGPQLASFVL